eukprot:TRINITY_DN47154_c1_g1_i1.p1 TRINITY_DN47154_c1_g1~~TRINITY_DN47154_c1_g1_i1.p1  ORF type:complete len:147 (-),score=3.04 TRINITY_DN47154_c1_g1_i1:846-1286(-)
MKASLFAFYFRACLFHVIEYLGLYLFNWLKMKNRRLKSKNDNQTTSPLMETESREYGKLIPSHHPSYSIPRKVKVPSTSPPYILPSLLISFTSHLFNNTCVELISMKSYVFYENKQALNIFMLSMKIFRCISNIGLNKTGMLNLYP